MTTKLKNANLYELLIQYLEMVGTDEAEKMIDVIIQQHNYGEVEHEHVSDVEGSIRIKRGSDWNSTTSSYYDLVASYSQRRDDVLTYPAHKAFIWGNQYGISNLNLRVGAGAFIGVNCGNTTKSMKIFAKTAAVVHLLGRTINVAHLEYSDYTENGTLYHNIYVKLGPSVRKRINKEYDLSCRSGHANLWDTSFTIFNLRFSFFVYVTTIDFYIKGTANTRGDSSICLCPENLIACANVVPSVTLRVNGGARAGLAVSSLHNV